MENDRDFHGDLEFGWKPDGEQRKRRAYFCKKYLKDTGYVQKKVLPSIQKAEKSTSTI